MIKLGVIGIGKMGGYHASICQTLPGVKLIGIADPNEENLKKIKIKLAFFNSCALLISS